MSMTREQALESINCIERVCCPPTSTLSKRTVFLCGLGADEKSAASITAEMERLGLAFCNRELTDAIAMLADHPGRKT